MNQSKPSLSQVENTIETARIASQHWSVQAVEERLKPVKRFRQLLVSKLDETAKLIRDELGKSREEFLSSEVLGTAEACRFLLKNSHRLLKPRTVSGSYRPVWMRGQKDVIHRRPR
ncbi:MAG: aldehyde dehydrogenase family protein, partial [Gemmataceae bacterium]